MSAENVLYLFIVNGLSRELRQARELELDSSNFGKNKAVGRCVGSSLNSDAAIGEVLSLEGIQHVASELLCLVQQNLLSSQVVGTEESSQVTDDGLKELDLLGRVLGHGELCLDPLQRLIELVVEAHDDKGVQTVDHCCAPAVEGVPESSADRLNLIVSPGVCPVSLPGVLESIPDRLQASFTLQSSLLCLCRELELDLFQACSGALAADSLEPVLGRAGQSVGGFENNLRRLLGVGVRVVGVARNSVLIRDSNSALDEGFRPSFSETLWWVDDEPECCQAHKNQEQDKQLAQVDGVASADDGGRVTFDEVFEAD